MSFFAAILTVVIIINCLALILLVLVQLPKKDAGAGLAFGAGAADALFGAGSGNALTKITKWATISFLALALILGYVQESLHHKGGGADFLKQVQQKQNQAPAAPLSAPVPQSSAPVTIPAAVSAATNAAK